MQTPLEHILSHAFKEQMMAYAAAHQEDFEELIDLAICDRRPYNWRGAWLLCSTMGDNDLRVGRRLDDLIAVVSSCEPNHQRELMRVLLRMELNDEQEGVVYDLAVKNWERLGLKPAVRYIAFRMILKIAKKYPELRDEIRQLTQEHYLESLSPGVRNSVWKMVKLV